MHTPLLLLDPQPTSFLQRRGKAALELRLTRFRLDSEGSPPVGFANVARLTHKQLYRSDRRTELHHIYWNFKLRRWLHHYKLPPCILGVQRQADQELPQDRPEHCSSRRSQQIWCYRGPEGQTQPRDVRCSEAAGSMSCERDGASAVLHRDYGTLCSPPHLHIAA